MAVGENNVEEDYKWCDFALESFVVLNISVLLPIRDPIFLIEVFAVLGVLKFYI